MFVEPSRMWPGSARTYSNSVNTWLKSAQIWSKSVKFRRLSLAKACLQCERSRGPRSMSNLSARAKTIQCGKHLPHYALGHSVQGKHPRAPALNSLSRPSQLVQVQMPAPTITQSTNGIGPTGHERHGRTEPRVLLLTSLCRWVTYLHRAAQSAFREHSRPAFPGGPSLAEEAPV